MKQPTIALLTDFGTADGYVGAMKGRISSIAPEARIIDISHEILPYDIRQAAFCLNNCYPYFPDKTIFVVVVDPGVGTKRKGIVVRTSQHYFVGPDNGVFSFVFQREGYQSFEILTNAMSEEISQTFHGRDVFARIASWISSGKPVKKYFASLKHVESFLVPAQKASENEFCLEIIHIDHFGNLILNFHKNDWWSLEGAVAIRVKFKDIELTQIHPSFGSVAEGEFLLSWDSSGFLQIAQNQGNAAKKLNFSVGDQIQLFI